MDINKSIQYHLESYAEILEHFNIGHGSWKIVSYLDADFSLFTPRIGSKYIYWMENDIKYQESFKNIWGDGNLVLIEIRRTLADPIYGIFRAENEKKFIK